MDGDTIVRVFPDRRAAAKSLGYADGSRFGKFLKRDGAVNGVVYKAWRDLPLESRDNFEVQNQKIPWRNFSNSRGVRQLDPNSGAVVCEYATTREVEVNFQMKRGTLFSACAGGFVERGFKWQLTEDDNYDDDM